MVGFNMLASYNIQDSFSGFDFYNKDTSPMYIGLILTTVVGYVLLGGGERIIKFATLLVPIMGLIYIGISAYVVLNNIDFLPEMFRRMFAEAFDFQAIFGGFTGSCVMYGIKRALFSNEAGMGSAPNAAGCADVSHPVKQGLVPVFSVFLDTMIICTATALMCLSSGIEPTAELNGVPYVLKVAESAFGSYGNIIIAVTITLFAFTTIIGNLFYVDKSFFYIFRTVPNKSFFLIYRLFATFIVMIGALLSSELLWGIADITMGCMALINVVTIVFLSKYVVGALKDYQKQRKAGVDPHFKASSIGLENQTDYWK
jgi:AGCS family alanine or glycine:cation symporter